MGSGRCCNATIVPFSLRYLSRPRSLHPFQPKSHRYVRDSQGLEIFQGVVEGAIGNQPGTKQVELDASW